MKTCIKKRNVQQTISSGSVWETKEETEKLVNDFFQNVLLIDNPEWTS